MTYALYFKSSEVMILCVRNRPKFKYFTHYFPLSWSICAPSLLSLMFKCGLIYTQIWSRMEKSSLNILLNISHVLWRINDDRVIIFRGFFEARYFAKCITRVCWNVLVPPATFAVFPDFLFTVMYNALCLWPCWQISACNSHPVKGPNTLVPVQWVHSWIRHDPYSHTTQNGRLNGMFLGEEKYVGA